LAEGSRVGSDVGLGVGKFILYVGSSVVGASVGDALGIGVGRPKT